jgi:DNA-binding response OmpR family regulator
VRILLAEDDRRMAALVGQGLREEGHDVEVRETGPLACEAAIAPLAWDVVILDVMLPGLSGIEIVRRLRATGRSTPVLMLTARDATADVVAGLDAGADDYLTKPFAFDVLLARIRALGRRTAREQAPCLTVGDLVLDAAGRVVRRGGDVVDLTRTEFTLLEILMRRPGTVVTRERLIERIWGHERDIESNTLDAFVHLLRQKIDGPGRLPLVHTIRGVGYVLREELER